MTKEQLTAYVKDKLNGGITNSDTIRKFHPADVEISIGQVIADIINSSSETVFVSNYLKRYKVNLDDNNRGTLPVAYIPMADGFPVRYAEDKDRTTMIFPRKGFEARAVLNNLQASRSINTFSVQNTEIVFDLTSIDCSEFYVYLHPEYKALEDDDVIFLPPNFESVIADRVFEREVVKHQIPEDNTNDGV